MFNPIRTVRLALAWKAYNAANAAYQAYQHKPAMGWRVTVAHALHLDLITKERHLSSLINR